MQLRLFLQVFKNITDTDQPFKVAMFDDRHMTEPPLVHDTHDVTGIV